MPRPEQYRDIRPKYEVRAKSDHANLLQEMAAALDIEQFLREFADKCSRLRQPRRETRGSGRRELDTVQELMQHAAYVQTLLECVLSGTPDQALINLRAAGPGGVKWIHHLAIQVYPGLFKSDIELETRVVPLPGDPDLERAVVVNGIAALPLTQIERGTHLFSPVHGAIVPVQVTVWPVPPGSEPLEVLHGQHERQVQWRQRFAKGEASIESAPDGYMPVVAVHQENSRRVDLRSGLTYSDYDKEWLLAALPTPPEWID
jgi:hypothetical protein